MVGTIITVDVARGFGFIQPRSGGQDVFYHATDLDGLVFDHRLEQLVVEFQLVGTPRGPKAVNVRKAD